LPQLYAKRLAHPILQAADYVRTMQRAKCRMPHVCREDGT
jgi:hypothetical protein